MTFLLTDIAGSTQLWEDEPVLARVAVERHEVLVRQVVEMHGGTIVRSRGEGDNLFVVFENCDDAVRAAAAIQRLIAATDWNLPSPLRMRMGIHCGPTQYWQGSYYGQVVNRAARIRSAAHPGQILASREVVRYATGSASEGITFRSLGSHRLKDLAQPQPIFEVRSPDTKETFPPLRTGKFDGLPNQKTPFVGRKQELNELQSRLEENRLVTILGSVGAGKSRLALEFATRHLDQADANVLYIAARKGFSKTNMEMLVRDRLTAESNALLILDADPWLPDWLSPYLEGLLQDYSEISIVVAARTRVGIPEEYVFSLAGFSSSNGDGTRFWLDRKASCGALPDDQIGSPLRIVQVLAGHPLCLEIVASLDLSPEQLSGLEGVEFIAPDLNLAPRHRSAQAMLQSTTERLGSEERDALRSLAAFEGEFTKAGARQIGVTDPQFLRLSEVSAFDHVINCDDGTWFRLPELVRIALREQLPNSELRRLQNVIVDLAIQHPKEVSNADRLAVVKRCMKEQNPDAILVSRSLDKESFSQIEEQLGTAYAPKPARPE